MSSSSDFVEGISCLSPIKVVLLGSAGSGKTSIITRYIDNTFNLKQISTIGATFQKKKFVIDQQQVSLRIWDTSGQERFRSIVPLYYRLTRVAVLVFDITKQNSLDELSFWVDQLQNQLEQLPLLVVVGNKSDLKNLHKDCEKIIENGKQFAESIGATFSLSSALSGEGINDFFYNVAKTILDEKLAESEDDFNSEDNGNIENMIIIKTKEKSVCCK
ncbi:ras and ef-hand domain-containing protein [Anaeramoeba flamelloides]|uniref:Ras and ef-hand domain-containing protein n=1 Tax=Anaeramoeba flamelloides TaxID=1746091 RepID=A0AAV7ZIT8_9EUKA|nr:ras and ef-hand domain-containing protein [Anaeramoeba flamelloides]